MLPLGGGGGRRCVAFLAAALALDVAGLGLVLAGAVARPRLDGASFEDFLVLTGALLLFLSLLCWLLWYSGNLRGIPDPELPLLPLGRRQGAPPRRRSPAQSPSATPRLLRLAAKLVSRSQRLSRGQRSSSPPRQDPGPTSAKGPRGAGRGGGGDLPLSPRGPTAAAPQERLV